MLYVGHFSFADPDSGTDEVPWHGLFTLVAEGKSVGVAVRKFERQIRDLDKRHGLFDGVSEIYLDTCVELRTVPRAGYLARELDDPLEHRVEVELGRQREARLDQHPIARAQVWGRCHGRSVARAGSARAVAGEASHRAAQDVGERRPRARFVAGRPDTERQRAGRVASGVVRRDRLHEP